MRSGIESTPLGLRLLEVVKRVVNERADHFPLGNPDDAGGLGNPIVIGDDVAIVVSEQAFLVVEFFAGDFDDAGAVGVLGLSGGLAEFHIEGLGFAGLAIGEAGEVGGEGLVLVGNILPENGHLHNFTSGSRLPAKNFFLKPSKIPPGVFS